MLNCFCNHPRRICCPSLNVRCENQVVNPVLLSDYGFFYNTVVGEIADDAIIPLTFVLGRGTSITSSSTTAGAITLLPGTYEVSYFASGTIPEGGTLGIGLELNGTDVVGSTISETGTAGDTRTLTQTMLINVPSVSTLELVNKSGAEATFSYASVAITRL